MIRGPPGRRGRTFPAVTRTDMLISIPDGTDGRQFIRYTIDNRVMFEPVDYGAEGNLTRAPP